MNSARLGSRSAVRFGPAGAVVLAVAVAAVVLLGGQALLGAGAIGIGVDDYFHALRFDEWLRSGWYVPSSLLAGGEPESINGQSTPFVYGAAFSVVAHLVNVVAGNEPIGDISTEADAYAVRHLVGAVIGLAGVLCVGGTVWKLTRDRIAAVWGAAALLAIPAWTGYSMFSNKDVPVAVGFTTVTFALVLGLSWAGAGERRSRRRPVAIAALIALGAFIGVGTRSAMWLPFLLSIGVFTALVWLSTRSRAAALRALAPAAIGFLVAVAVIAALHPRTASQPVDWLVNSVTDSSEYGREGVFTLTAGQFLDEFPPPWYLPVWTLAVVPVLITAIAAIGALTAGRDLARLRPAAAAGESASVAVGGGTLLVAVQLLLLPAGALVLGSASSSGLRQHLYVLPPIAILAGLGAARLLRLPRAGAGGRRFAGWVVPLLLCLALVIPGVEQSRLYPYNYVYLNPVAGIGGVEGRWETEYQFLAAREAFERVPASVEPLCSGWLIARRGETHLPVIEACGANLAPYTDEVGAEATATASPGARWVVGRMRADGQPPRYCAERDNVTRPLRGEELVMAYVLECSRPGGEPP